jgi:hypothetical protein
VPVKSDLILRRPTKKTKKTEVGTKKRKRGLRPRLVIVLGAGTKFESLLIQNRKVVYNKNELFAAHQVAVRVHRADLPPREARLPLQDPLQGQAPVALARPVAPAAPGEAENRKESELAARELHSQSSYILIDFAAGQARAGVAVPTTKKGQALPQRRVKIKTKRLMRNQRQRKSQNHARGPGPGK